MQRQPASLLSLQQRWLASQDAATFANTTKPAASRPSEVWSRNAEDRFLRQLERQLRGAGNGSDLELRQLLDLTFGETL
jgi:hypothetical protein